MMSTRQILSILLLMLGTIAAILPRKEAKFRKFTKEELAIEVEKNLHYVSADELAHLIIEGNPSIRLIDIRLKENADSMLTGAINIPHDSILNEHFAVLFDQTAIKNILYSDNEKKQKDTWTQLKYEGYPAIYMLKGGLNEWKEHILNPTYPGINASQDKLDLYNQRMAARQYFSGIKTLPKTEFKVIIPSGKRKKKKVEGGCS